MLKEGTKKESRGWIYKELTFDFPKDKKPTDKKEDSKLLKGIQLSMF